MVRDPAVVGDAVRASCFSPSVVLCGGAPGVDRLGSEWAKARGIPVEDYPAEWEKFGKRAGPIRNIVMANAADALIAVWDYKSPGTRHMIGEATRRRLKVYIHDAHLPPSEVES